MPPDRARLASPLALGGCDGLVIIDEIQRRELGFELRGPRADRGKAKFLVLGSAALNCYGKSSDHSRGASRMSTSMAFARRRSGRARADRLWLRVDSRGASWPE